MRTPPPVLPDDPQPGYSRTLLDRLGPDGAMEIRARFSATLGFLVTAPICAMASQYRPLTAPHPVLTGVVGGALGAGLIYVMMSRMPGLAGDVATRVTMPRGTTTPYEEQFSFEESLAARGDVAGALAAFEQAIAERPGVVAPRMRAAELYAGRGANPARAAELFREIRGIEGVSGRDALYACSRLVDLYDGPLDDPGRALVELRRIIEQHPTSRVAEHARAALPRLKARLQESRAADR